MQRKHLFFSLCLLLGFTGAFASGPGTPLPAGKTPNSNTLFLSPAPSASTEISTAPATTFAFYGINGMGLDMNILVTNTSTYASQFYVLPALSYYRTFLGDLEPGYYNISVTSSPYPSFFTVYASGQSGLGGINNVLLNASNDQMVITY